MTKENPNCVIVESGNLSNMRDRLGLVASILAGMRYDAVGVGDTDLRTFGADFFKEVADNKLTVLDASPDAPKTALPYLMKNVDGVKVGIISFSAVLPEANINEYNRRKALYAAYKEARAASEILIVLDQANLVSREWVERNATRLGAPDIVIAGIQRMGLMQEDVVGRTHFMPTSIQGKHVGVADVEIAQGREPAYKVLKLPLESNVAEDEAVAKRVTEFMTKNRPQIVNAQPQYTTPNNPAANQKPYYSPVLCRMCHLKHYEDWKTTKHAGAVKTLTAQQRAIPECLKCHSEMYRRQERVTVVSDIPAGVECATCHLGSLPHGSERKNVATRVKVDPKTCVECHSKEWSPNYDEKSYMAKVSHTGVGAATAETPTFTAPPAAATPPAARPAVRSTPPAPPMPPGIRPPAHPDQGK